MSTVTENLQRARDLLTAPESWTQKRSTSVDGNAHCLGYTVNIVLDEQSETGHAENDLNKTPEFQLLAQAISYRGGTYAYDALSRVVVFNDATSTTHADVLDVLDHAIRLSRDQELLDARV